MVKSKILQAREASELGYGIASSLLSRRMQIALDNHLLSSESSLVLVPVAPTTPSLA